MTVQTAEELAGLQAAGRAAAATLAAMKAAVRPGVSGADLDAIGAETMLAHGARSAPVLVYRFPTATCISLNDAIVHGVPGLEPLVPGDVVKLDVTVEKDGFMADCACTVVVPGGSAPNAVGVRLAAAAKSAFQAGLRAARVGAGTHRIGRAVEAEVTRHGFSVIPELLGHGIGRTIHEAPEVPNHAARGEGPRLDEGTVITIEPLICAGKGRSVVDDDGWTIRTKDGSLAAHFEHTLVVRRGGPLILTAA